MQDLMDEQRHQGTAYAERGEAVGQVGRRGGPPGAIPNRAGQRRQRAGRRALTSLTPVRHLAQHDRRQDRGHDEQAAVDEERRPQRPRRHQATHRGPADPTEQEAAAEQAAGPAALAGRHGAEEQGLGADAEHRRAHPAAAAQHHELDERLGEPGQDAARRDHRDSRGHHAWLAEPVHQAARGQRSDHPHQREHADYAGRRGHAHIELAGEGRDSRSNEPEPESDCERDRREDRHFGGQIVERASSHGTHETALCQLTRWSQRGHGARMNQPGENGAMASHVALLRGINVGGRNKVPMADLREVVTSLGHTGVSTYIQSGNVLFSTAEDDTAKLAAALESAIEDRFGIWSSVVVLSRDELARVLAANPYPDEPNPRMVHVVFLNGSPPRDLLDRITAAESAAAAKGSRDTVHSAGPAAGQPQALFLHTPDGFGTSELAQNVLKILAPPKKSKPGLAATARNWATATKLLSLSEENKED